MMDNVTLARIDDELESSEVAALCFLCRDVVKKKRLEGIKDARELFIRLREQGLLENLSFLSELLHTIRRADLLNLLETDSRRPVDTDANPILSEYRVMLFRINEDMTKENFERMAFMLNDKMGRGSVETCKTVLDLFAEMEKKALLSNTKLDLLHDTLKSCDQQLALAVQNYKQRVIHQPQTAPSPSHVSMDYQTITNRHPMIQPSLSISETGPSNTGQMVVTDAEPTFEPAPLPDPSDYYSLSHNPRGLCVVINNEKFLGGDLKDRTGTAHDERVLCDVFEQLGFITVVYNNLTANDMRARLQELGRRNFLDDDLLVVCVLSHGDNGCVYGTDEQKVILRELTSPFTSWRAPTLAGKPKLFFIQACQGDGYQIGAQLCPPRPEQERSLQEPGASSSNQLEEDAGPVAAQTVPSDADFLLGMATVSECRSFRHTSTGSIYIQELCKQLMRSARSSENDDILGVLLRVNRIVSEGVFRTYKQMPEPKYTLTKRLVLKCV